MAWEIALNTCSSHENRDFSKILEEPKNTVHAIVEGKPKTFTCQSHSSYFRMTMLKRSRLERLKHVYLNFCNRLKCKEKPGERDEPWGWPSWDWEGGGSQTWVIPAAARSATELINELYSPPGLSHDAQLYPFHDKLKNVTHGISARILKFWNA